jgi:HSP20 family protein
MLLTRWNPLSASWLNQMQQLQNEMNRVFERWGDDGRSPSELAGYPAVNVWEEDEAFVAETELPGFELKDVEIYVAGRNQLTIKGERKPAAPEKSVQHRQERAHGKFVRTLTLPSQVDEAKIEARFENGVLTIRLPKHEAAKPRRIPIKA